MWEGENLTLRALKESLRARITCRSKNQLGQTGRRMRVSRERVGGGGEKQGLSNISNQEENYIERCWLASVWEKLNI